MQNRTTCKPVRNVELLSMLKITSACSLITKALMVRNYRADIQYGHEARTLTGVNTGLVSGSWRKQKDTEIRRSTSRPEIWQIPQTESQTQTWHKTTQQNCPELGQRSRYSTTLRAGHPTILGRGKRFVSSLNRPGWLSDPPSLLFNGTRGAFPRSKEVGAWSSSLTSI
jgi:hypothetical protein